MDPLKTAIKYLRRQDRTEHPDGEFDGPRWYPSDDEWQLCCSGLRAPSRAFPWSLMVHCRTIEHVAQLCDVSAPDVRRTAKWLKTYVDPSQYDALDQLELSQHAWLETDRSLKAVLDIRTLISGGQVTPLTARKMQNVEAGDVVKLTVTCWPDIDPTVATTYAEALTTGVVKAGTPVAGWVVELAMAARSAA